jgi:hypothetical protein
MHEISVTYLAKMRELKKYFHFFLLPAAKSGQNAKYWKIEGQKKRHAILLGGFFYGILLGFMS